MAKRTILLLSAKRCGSTAVFTMFQKHPEVGVCHVDAEIDLWEPNFWNLAAEAVAGRPERFVERFRASHPFLKMPQRFTDRAVFSLWDEILERLGPIVFDKSPQYLGSPAALELIRRYRDAGADVRVFGMIRDARDAIASQWTRWRGHVPGDSLAKRERSWLEKYANLEVFQSRFGFTPVFRYEDFAAAPQCYAPMIFHHAGVRTVASAYVHVRPTNVGRFAESADPELRRWRISPELERHLARYGYVDRSEVEGRTGLLTAVPEAVSANLLRLRRWIRPRKAAA